METTKQSILLFVLDITEKDLGWSQQKRPHAPPDIANYLMLSVIYATCVLLYGSRLLFPQPWGHLYSPNPCFAYTVDREGALSYAVLTEREAFVSYDI